MLGAAAKPCVQVSASRWTRGATMLDWDAVMPPPPRPALSQPGQIDAENRGYPRLHGTTSVIPGIARNRQDRASRDQSPESPLSPVQKHRTDTEAGGRGAGEGKIYCARESIFRSLDDLRTCDLCGNLTETGRCSAAARREIVAMRGYEPVRDLPKRCEAYKPPPDDPDQRPGRERWPGLTW